MAIQILDMVLETVLYPCKWGHMVASFPVLCKKKKPLCVPEIKDTKGLIFGLTCGIIWITDLSWIVMEGIVMDIIYAVFPLLITSAVVVAIILFCKKKYQTVSAEKANELSDDATQTSKKRNEGKYVAYGISFGTCAGAGIGSALLAFGIFGINSLAYGSCFGMLAGLIVGLCFEKPQASNSKE
jgi:F0F1-type ATP synthase assembly protein I